MKILFVSLGCDKNLVDSERMLGLLEGRGYEFTDDESEADIAVVNTCCFINDAKEESIHTLLQLGDLRSAGKLKALIAAGCLAQRYQEEIQREIPEVDAVLGTTAIDSIVSAVEEVLAGRGQNHYNDLNARPLAGGKRIVTTGGHFAYLKIAEGCDKCCTYCIIPRVRGKYRSVPMEELLAEAEELAEAGVKELILVAQETTLYGADLYGEKRLPRLLHELAQINGIRWIRRRADRCDRIGTQGVPLPGYSDPARLRSGVKADGAQDERGGASGRNRQTAGADTGHLPEDHIDQRIPRGDPGGSRKAVPLCQRDGV